MRQPPERLEAPQRRPRTSPDDATAEHGTALLVGMAAFAPLAGAIIDAHGAGWAFAVAGLIGVGTVLVAMPFWRRPPRPPGTS